ncbi:MAG TPA: redoxin domain-containing protein [Planctomycetota bacterium]|nr:redoxin domain-containing protein [Planctomycetota bacterium]
MGTHARTVAALAVVLLAGAATAQVKKGERPPEFTFGKVWNDGPKSFAELAGKVVIVEYSHSKHDVCKKSVPHFNELHKKFASRGLVVLGVSSEPEATIEQQFVTGMGAIYPWIKSNDFREKYKVEYLPCCFCFDAYGNVYSLPDWWVPDEATIEELLQALPLPPELPADRIYDTMRVMWARSEFDKLHQLIEKRLATPKLDEPVREVLEGQKTALAEREARWLERVGQIGARADYASAASELDHIVKSWGDLPPGASAKKELERFAADPKIKVEVDAGRALQKLMDGVDTSRIPALRKVINDLDKFRRKYKGTWAGTTADFHHTRLCARPDGS